MHVIVSHDVDHLRTSEHWKDAILPKMLLRAMYELISGRISAKELALRWAMPFHGRMERIEEVMRFDERMGVRSCFFFGMSNGLGLNYARARSVPHIHRAIDAGFEVGVHGIAFDDEAAMREERNAFATISGLDVFGVRMHYLRQAPDTFEKLERIGYHFDATSRDLAAPHRIGGMWEFPVHEMDTWALCGNARYQARSTEAAVAHTMEKFDRAQRDGITCFSLLFHDVYYTSAFQSWKDWYEQVIRALAQRGCTFINHAQAIDRLRATA